MAEQNIDLEAWIDAYQPTENTTETKFREDKIKAINPNERRFGPHDTSNFFSRDDLDQELDFND